MLRLISDIKSSTVASFKLNGEKIDVIPCQMVKSANSYSKKMGDLLIVLNFEEVAANMYRWTLKLTNKGVAPTGQITELYGMDLNFAVDDDAIWESINGDNSSKDSFMPRVAQITDEFSFTQEARGGRSSQGDAFPYFDVTSGEDTAVFAIGWTGQWKYTLTRIGNTAHIAAGFTDCDMYLNRGESIRSVGALVYFGKGKLRARQDFRRIFREKLSPASKMCGRLDVPISLQMFDRYFWSTPEWRNEAGQLQTIECANKLGYINTYWLDAAWFEKCFPWGVGNYKCHEGLPNGLSPVSDLAHKYGMRFMLWFEPERNCGGTDTVMNHPEYMLTVDGNNQYLFDLSNDEAREWLFDTLAGVIRENGIDIYRQDFNIDPLEFWRKHDPPSKKGYTENKYVTGLYRLWDDLLNEFPGLMIDNCASGGRRLDFEANMRSIPVWRSDTNCSPVKPDQPNHYWNQNHTIGVNRYLPYHAGSTWDTKAFIFRSGMTKGIACNWPAMDDDFDAASTQDPLSELTAICDCWDGDFYPLTEATHADDCWCAYQFAMQDKGYCLFFRRENDTEPQKTFNINGIDVTSDYEVTTSNEEYEMTTMIVKGADMVNYTAIIQNPLESLMLSYKKL